MKDPSKDEQVSVTVLHNGSRALERFNVSLGETVGAVDERLTAALSLPATHRLLLRGKRMSEPATTMASLGVREGDKLYVLSSAEAAVEAIRSAVPDPLVRGFSSRRASNAAAPARTQSRAAVASLSPYGFQSIRELPGYPDAARARELLETLANDPGFARVMQERRWSVGCLAEMEPEGKVGVDPVCVLGYNVNKGAEINLRLRTDDRKGFRPLYMLKKVLAHELAHNEHSEHDTKFYELMRQIERDAKQYDWRQSTGSSISGRDRPHAHEGPVARDPLDFEDAQAAAAPRFNIARRLGSGDGNMRRDGASRRAEASSALGQQQANDALVANRQTEEPSQACTHDSDAPAAAGSSESAILNDTGDTSSPDRNGEEAPTSSPADSALEPQTDPESGTDPGTPASSPLDSLLAMGFPPFLSKIALREQRNEISKAAEYLIERLSSTAAAGSASEPGSSTSVLGVAAASSSAQADSERSNTHISYLVGTIQALVESAASQESALNALNVLHLYAYNAHRVGAVDARARRINANNRAFRERVGSLGKPATVVLGALGFELKPAEIVGNQGERSVPSWDGDRESVWELDVRVAEDSGRMWLAKTAIVDAIVSLESANSFPT